MAATASFRSSTMTARLEPTSRGQDIRPPTPTANGSNAPSGRLGPAGPGTSTETGGSTREASPARDRITKDSSDRGAYQWSDTTTAPASPTVSRVVDEAPEVPHLCSQPRQLLAQGPGHVLGHAFEACDAIYQLVAGARQGFRGGGQRGVQAPFRASQRHARPRRGPAGAAIRSGEPPRPGGWTATIAACRGHWDGAAVPGHRRVAPTGAAHPLLGGHDRVPSVPRGPLVVTRQAARCVGSCQLRVEIGVTRTNVVLPSLQETHDVADAPGRAPAGRFVMDELGRRLVDDPEPGVPGRRKQ